MPKFNFEFPTSVPCDEAYGKIKNFLNSDNTFKKFDSKLSCTFDEPARKVQLNGGQFKASLVVAQNAANSQIKIEVEVPLALALFKGKIQEELEKTFKKVIG